MKPQSPESFSPVRVVTSHSCFFLSCRTLSAQPMSPEGWGHLIQRAWPEESRRADQEAAGRPTGRLHVHVQEQVGPGTGRVHVAVQEAAGCSAGRLHVHGGTEPPALGLRVGLKGVWSPECCLSGVFQVC